MTRLMLVTKVGWIDQGRIFWTDKLDGGPFAMELLPEPPMPDLVDVVPGQPVYGQRRPEGVSFAIASRVSDGALVSVDVTHPAWVLREVSVE